MDARILVGAMMLRDELAKAALDTKEPALHIPQQSKGTPCPAYRKGGTCKHVLLVDRKCGDVACV